MPYPTLSLTRAGAISSLTWTNSERGYKVQATATLPSGWTNVNQTITDANGHFSTSETATEPIKYYRLKK